MTVIGDTGVSLVCRSYVTTDSAGQGRKQHPTLHDTVYWKVEGLVKLRAIVEEWIGHLESFSRFMTMRPSIVSRVNCHMADLADPGHCATSANPTGPSSTHSLPPEIRRAAKAWQAGRLSLAARRRGFPSRSPATGTELGPERRHTAPVASSSAALWQAERVREEVVPWIPD